MRIEAPKQAKCIESHHASPLSPRRRHGAIDAVCVHPREVARVVVASDATSLILFRNARWDFPEPSEADGLVVRRIRDALALIDVRVLDYLLIGTGCRGRGSRSE